MNRMRTMVAALAVVATASLALAQNADKNSAGPTKNDYRLKVVEPREGATVNGSTVRVVVDTRIPAEIGTEKRDVNSMPRPMVDVFLDNTNQGSLKEEQNVIEITSVAPGAHKLVLVAKNMSGEIIGRQEVNFTSTAASTQISANPAPDTSTSTYTAPKDNDQAMSSSSTPVAAPRARAPTPPRRARPRPAARAPTPPRRARPRARIRLRARRRRRPRPAARFPRRRRRTRSWRAPVSRFSSVATRCAAVRPSSRNTRMRPEADTRDLRPQPRGLHTAR